jgi:membrane dipeptidase
MLRSQRILKDKMTRADFLRLFGSVSIGVMLSGSEIGLWGQKKTNSDSADEFIESLFSESLVFDGCGSLGIKRSAELVSQVPGDIKRLTGIDVGTQGVRPHLLSNRNKWIEQHKDGFFRIDRASDIEMTKTTNKYGMLYYTQLGFDLKGSAEPLAQWKEEGLRSLQITYGDNELGGGSRSDDTPLSSLGKQVVREMNRLRMVVDVSHSGKRTTLDVCQASAYPVTANHANVQKLSGHRRNKSDEELKAIAGTGGVVGVTSINRFVLQNRSRPATIKDFVDHVDYLVQLIGIDHVGLASDCGMDGTQRYEVDFSGPLLNSYDRWRHVAVRLRKMGYSREDIQKILGLNFKNVFYQVLDP